MRHPISHAGKANGRFWPAVRRSRLAENDPLCLSRCGKQPFADFAERPKRRRSLGGTFDARDRIGNGARVCANLDSLCRLDCTSGET